MSHNYFPSLFYPVTEKICDFDGGDVGSLSQKTENKFMGQDSIVIVLIEFSNFSKTGWLYVKINIESDM